MSVGVGVGVAVGVGTGVKVGVGCGWAQATRIKAVTAKRKGQRKAVRMPPSVVEPEFQYKMNLERYHCAKVVLLPPLPIPPTPETSP